MMNTHLICTKSINELIANPTTPPRTPRVEHFLIPDYQRGYRWQAQVHVKELLEDLERFFEQRKTTDCNSKIYCLQPIVVVPQEDEEGMREWELIDGQQRLTTLHLILKALEQPSFNIRYTHRPKSSEVLQHPEQYDDSMPDHYFICEAYKYIQQWLEERSQHSPNFKMKFYVELTEYVQVIWYEVPLQGQTESERQEEKIDIFNRLNIGKIPLDDAELIRALFIQNIDATDEREIVLRQSILSGQWSEITHFLSDEGVWGFIHNNERKGAKQQAYDNRILRLFEIVAGQKDSAARATYMWFEQALRASISPHETARELWNKVVHLYECIRQWYHNSTYYHGIGLLVVHPDGKSLPEIYHEYGQRSKHAFRQWLWQEVKRIYPSDYQDEELSYEGNRSEVTHFLLLFNVLTHLRESNLPHGVFFPFGRYQTTKWSIEHICAQQTEDPLKHPKLQQEWISETLAELTKLENVLPETMQPHRQRLEAWKKEGVSEKDSEAFNAVANQVRAFFTDSTEGDMHRLSNLALLPRRTNSALNNAIFPRKRELLHQRMLAKSGRQEKGDFVPLCTLRVFEKYYSSAYTERYKWNKNDREDYLNAIAETMKLLDTLASDKITTA